MADIPYWKRGKRDFVRARQRWKKILSLDSYEQDCPHKIPDDGGGGGGGDGGGDDKMFIT
jgi:hypothetical protein